MFVINPPWQLPEQLKQAMPVITKLLSADDSAEFNLDYNVT